MDTPWYEVLQNLIGPSGEAVTRSKIDAATTIALGIYIPYRARGVHHCFSSFSLSIRPTYSLHLLVGISCARASRNLRHHSSLFFLFSFLSPPHFVPLPSLACNMTLAAAPDKWKDRMKAVVTELVQVSRSPRLTPHLQFRIVFFIAY